MDVDLPLGEQPAARFPDQLVLVESGAPVGLAAGLGDAVGGQVAPRRRAIAAHLDQGIGDGVPQVIDRGTRALLVVDVPLQDRRPPAGRRLAGVDRNQDGGFAEQGRDVLRRALAPIRPTPRSIIAQAAGSGTVPVGEKETSMRDVWPATWLPPLNSIKT